MLRICYYAYPNSIHTKRWLTYFVSQGHDIHLLNDGKENITLEDVTIHNCYVEQKMPPLRWISRLAQLRHILLEDIKPDIFHAHFVEPYGYWGALTAFHPFVLTPWGSDILVVPETSLIKRFFTKISVRAADLITVESEALFHATVKLGANPEKVQRILWGVDLEKFRNVDPTPLRKELGISPNDCVVLSMRNLEEIYNHRTVMQGALEVLKKCPNTYFLFVGAGTQKLELEDHAKRLGISNRTKVLGEQPHELVPQFMALSDIYISIPSSDSTSTTLLEAMASDKPVVVSDLPANKEWVSDNVNGFIVPPNSQQKVAEAIINLLQNKSLRDEFGRKNESIVRKDADFTDNMKRMEQLYLNLVLKYRTK